MPSRKGRDANLNRPLQRLAERLRALQQEAGQVLDIVRAEPRREPRGDPDPPSGESGDLAAALEAQISRRAAALLERWDIPTRADLAAIVQRIEQLERAVATLSQSNRKTSKTPVTPQRTSKARRAPTATKRRKT